MGEYRCKCGYSTDNLFVFLLHLDECDVAEIIPNYDGIMTFTVDVEE